MSRKLQRMAQLCQHIQDNILPGITDHHPIQEGNAWGSKWMPGQTQDISVDDVMLFPLFPGGNVKSKSTVVPRLYKASFDIILVFLGTKIYNSLTWHFKGISIFLEMSEICTHLWGISQPPISPHFLSCLVEALFITHLENLDRALHNTV